MKDIKGLNRFEKILWLISISAIIVSSILAGNSNYLTIVASLVGVTALIFVAKGNAIGQVLTVVFSILYAVISLEYRYYGEMITYLGMTAPIAVLSVVSWIRNPYDAEKREVRVAPLSTLKKWTIVLATLVITFIFYFILKACNTSNLIISTISIATSFMASALMFYRNPGYALAYAANDIVLITLWILASLENATYYSMVVCFIIFLCNDIYGYYNWKRMRVRQSMTDTP